MTREPTRAPRLGLRLGLLGLSIVWAAGLVSCLIEPEPADCDGATACSTCVERSGCGWCPGTGCVPASSLGPDDESLTCQDDFTFSWCVGYPEPEAEVVDPCGGAATCTDCAASGCVWCARVRGGACVSDGRTCTSDRQVRAPESCDSPFLRFDCDDYQTCGPCAGDPSCQWETDSGIQIRLYCDAESCPASGLEAACLPARECR